jgi:hypothetical protein
MTAIPLQQGVFIIFHYEWEYQLWMRIQLSQPPLYIRTFTHGLVWMCITTEMLHVQCIVNYWKWSGTGLPCVFFSAWY